MSRNLLWVSSGFDVYNATGLQSKDTLMLEKALTEHFMKSNAYDAFDGGVEGSESD